MTARQVRRLAVVAKQEGISVVAVAVRSGELLIGEAALGEWVWTNGGWHRRGS